VVLRGLSTASCTGVGSARAGRASGVPCRLSVARVMVMGRPRGRRMDELQQRRERHADEDATAAGGKVVRLAQRDRDAHRQDDVADVRDLEAKAADHDADVRDRSAERRDAAAAARDAGWVQWLGSLTSISISMVCSRLPMPVAPQRKLTKQCQRCPYRAIFHGSRKGSRDGRRLHTQRHVHRGRVPHSAGRN